MPPFVSPSVISPLLRELGRLARCSSLKETALNFFLGPGQSCLRCLPCIKVATFLPLSFFIFLPRILYSSLDRGLQQK